MLSINEKISLRQLQALIIISSIGTGVIILPRRVAQYAGSDGWIITLGLTALGMIIGALVVSAARLRPGDNFVQSTSYFLTRPVALILATVLWLKLVFSAGLELRAFMLVVREVLLRNTPIFVTGITMLIVAAYAAIKGIETRARVAELLLALMALPFIFLIVIAAMDVDWSNLQPAFTTSPQNLLSGILRLGFLFTGLECILLTSPFICPEKKMKKTVITALGFTGIIVTIITVLTLAKFGRGVADLPWPVLSMMDTLSLPGRFIERQEALMFSFWIITIFAYINMLIFFGGVLIKNCVYKEKDAPPELPHGPTRANKPWQVGVVITAAAAFCVTFIPWDEAAIYQNLDLMYITLGVFYLVALPLILILASKLKGKIKGKQAIALIAIGVIALGGLSACWDKVEIENRAFVVAVAIDAAEAEADDSTRYTVTISLPAANDSKEDEGEDAPPHIVKASAPTVAEAIKIIDTETKSQLYFGQVKILTLGDTLLDKPDLLRAALDIFNYHPEIARSVYVLASSGKGADILTARPQGDARPGRYIAAIYEDKQKIGGASFPLSLDKLVTQMKYDAAVLVPVIKAQDNKLDFQGAVILKDGKKIGEITTDELRGYLWGVNKGGLGAIVTVKSENHTVPVKVEKHSAKVEFKAGGNRLQAHIYVDITGHIEECPYTQLRMDLQHTSKLAEDTIKEEIQNTAKKMQDEFMADGYQWLEIMRKKQYNLYQRYAPQWGDAFAGIEIVPHVTVVFAK
ncbi:MAG: Ger(x)C family spore germination protein [Defluviitaleaceae bacterium]|nr:Ger(x)C family spore germination protein [Defluviitaleaceae bacterium]